ncbi:envelope stress response membrane protein PspC [Polymorphobacter fuscus]|uniref:Envelope stress response membrane protein PspC n=1 Tax=Sandarakinorhabdus fusca TaxID=1439888 RepID=A0A7C9KX44_9SPHN|nr:envelope stress response membrane protein PspC [Polymorphobacter fuscus]KAB7647856.1 envelope stress response membrane protein PspC [Polymorphobacter fuscus]MQT17162.1 envelope stress response membrane protein PspC [Polymorphobacter fuscus]NJC08844.1 phage shock protein C [Polymorphobacter fuscus]
MSVRRTRFYLDKRNKRFMGVCSGIADYFGWDATWVRVAAVAATVLGVGFLPFVYLAVGWIADPKPSMLYNDDPEEARFWKNVRVAPQRTVRDVHASFRESDRRLRDMEAYVTSSNSRLANEIEKLR